MMWIGEERKKKRREKFCKTKWKFIFAIPQWWKKTDTRGKIMKISYWLLISHNLTLSHSPFASVEGEKKTTAASKLNENEVKTAVIFSSSSRVVRFNWNTVKSLIQFHHTLHKTRLSPATWSNQYIQQHSTREFIWARNDAKLKDINYLQNRSQGIPEISLKDERKAVESECKCGSPDDTLQARRSCRCQCRVLEN